MNKTFSGLTQYHQSARENSSSKVRGGRQDQFLKSTVSPFPRLDRRFVHQRMLKCCTRLVWTDSNKQNNTGFRHLFTSGNIGHKLH